MSATLLYPRTYVLDGYAIPCAALGASLAVHVALALCPWSFPSGPPAAPPTLVVCRGEVAVVIERPAPSSRAAPSPAVPRVARPARPEAAYVPEERAPAAVSTSPLAPAPVRRAEEAPDESVTDARVTVERPSAPSEAPTGVAGAQFVAGSGKPRYPVECYAGAHRPEGCEGRGAYEVEIDADGRVLSCTTVSSAGCPHLDRAAELFFLRRAGFVPATAGGRRVPWRGVFHILFRLEDAAREGAR